MRIHDRKGRTRFNGHVDTTVLAELVAQVGKGFNGIAAGHRLLRGWLNQSVQESTV